MRTHRVRREGKDEIPFFALAPPAKSVSKISNPALQCRAERRSTPFKVARPSIFVATPSIFESLVLKQIDLSYKTNYDTCGTHRLSFIMILVLGRSESISCDDDVTIILALNRISALIGILFGNALR